MAAGGNQDFSSTISPSLASTVTAAGSSPSGTHWAIRREVEDPLAQWVTEGALPAAGTVAAKDGELVLEKS